MNKTMLDNVLTAIMALVADEATNGHPSNKFPNIARLCVYADSIRKLGISRVADAGALVDGEGGINVAQDAGDDFVGAPGYDIPVNFRGGGATAGIRLPLNPLAQATDMIRDFADLQSKPKALGTVDELDKLVGIRADLACIPGMNVDVIDRRIAAMIQKLATETETTTHDDNSNVVPPLIFRGHQNRIGERSIVHGDHDAADVQGTGGDRQVGGAGQEEGLARVVDQHEREEHASGADRESREGALEAAQAEPDDRLGGDVQQRDDGGNHGGDVGSTRAIGDDASGSWVY